MRVLLTGPIDMEPVDSGPLEHTDATTGSEGRVGADAVEKIVSESG